jgi:hypothetical protein
MNREQLLELAINKLGQDWSKLNWNFKDVTIKGEPDKMSQPYENTFIKL